jgi:uncharacterized repeat protein (TIGR01451 family)
VLTVTYSAGANGTASTRSSSIQIAGDSFSVTQLAVVPASLTIAKSHTGNFTQGQNGAAYTVTVSNQAGAGPTNSTVTVTETVPTGMTLVSMNGGATWNCSVLPNCTTSSVLNGGSSYPAITVTVNVASNAATPRSNSVTVSGGGSGSSSIGDSTIINAAGTSNVALGKTATQSSTYAAGTGAGNAVDGNTDGNFSHGSLTHTNLDANAWWQVDLGASATVNSVVVWNRTDCCGDRLSDYWVFISNTPFSATDTPATLQSRAGTYSSHQTSAPSPGTSISFSSALGQYVRVQLSDTNYLGLAEVQVMGTLAASSNVALGKTATQSSTYAANTGAGNAIDGNTDGNFSHGSLTYTNLDSNAWWQVDLGASATINSVVVWNRTDCCGDRLSDYWVFVSNTPFSATDTPATLQSRAGTYSSHQTSAPSPSTSISFSSALGQYVRVQLSAANYLGLAEVQVMGTIGASSNLALGKTATQSSTYAAGTGAGNAIDGNTDGNFSHGSLTYTNLDSNAWWQVDLGASATINSVVVWNRTDCCGDRLSDYWVFVSNTPFSATDTPATLQSRAGTYSSHQTSAPSPSTSISFGTVAGQYVRIQLSGANYLGLAEVQVMGTLAASSNVALGKTATQSSTYAAGTGAGNAIDGNTDGNFSHGSVSHTNLDSNAWWQVDLGASATVNSVVVWNRTDCCGDRLSDYWVFVSNTPFSATDTPATLQSRAGTYSSHQTSAPSPSASISFGGVLGRYVRVQLSGANYLGLAEVQVIGTIP